MRFILRIILVAVVGYAAGMFLPQWAVPLTMLGAFVVGILLSTERKRRIFGKKQPPAYAFLAGFMALFALWGILAWQQDLHNGGILGAQIAELFEGVSKQSFPTAFSGGEFLSLITGLLGGLIGGFSTMTGNLLGEAIKS